MATNGTQCTISVPGYFYRDNCTLLCKPASWTDIVVFFLGNYLTHVATVISEPGQGILSTVIMSLAALLFPGAGIAKAMNAIISFAIFAPTELQRAARAGALCMVVPFDKAQVYSVDKLEVPDSNGPSAREQDNDDMPVGYHGNPTGRGGGGEEIELMHSTRETQPSEELLP